MHITQEILTGIVTVVMAILGFAIKADLIGKLATAIAAYIAARLHLAARDRNEITHALDYALNRLAEGAISRQEALSHILATGAVKNSQAHEIVNNVANCLPIEKRGGANFVGQIPGVFVSVRPEGTVRVGPVSKPSKIYKINKFVKKKFGFML